MLSKYFRIQAPWTLSGLLLLTLGIMLLASSVNDYRQIKAEAQKGAQAQARLLHDALYDEVRSLIRTFDAASAPLAMALTNSNNEQAQTLLKLITGSKASLKDLAIKDEAGKLLASSTEDTTLADFNAVFEAHHDLANNQRLVSFTQGVNSQGKPMLVVNFQIKHQGEFSGILQGKLSLSHLNSLFGNLRLNETFQSGLALADGRLVLISPVIDDLLGQVIEQDDQRFPDHFLQTRAIDNLPGAHLQSPLYVMSWADAGPMKAAWRQRAISLFAGYVLFCALALGLLNALLNHHARREEARRLAHAEKLFNKERFKLATSSAGIGVWELNLIDQTLRWDETMQAMYGLGPQTDNITMEKWIGLIAHEHRTRVGLALAEAKVKGDVVSVEFEIVRVDDGQRRHIQARARLYQDDQHASKRLIGVNVDVSKEREFEAALRDAEEKFRSSFDWAAVGMAMVSLDGQFLRVNNSLCEMLGYTAREMVLMNFEQITHPQDTEQHIGLVREILQGNRNHYQLEKRYIHQTGRVLWVSLSVSAVRNRKGRVLYFITQIQDITERKRNEATLIEREHFLRTLSECLPGLVSYWSTDLRCHFANKNHEKWTAVTVEKMRGLHMRKLLGDEIFNNDRVYIDGVLRGEKQRFERRKPLPTGGHADMLVHLIPDVIYGKVEGFFSISTNITDFKAQQRELERINLALTDRTAQAEAASKAKGAFLANMSHEIRTPMNAIMGLLQLLEDTPLSHDQHDTLRKIGSAADVLLNVLNDILDVSRVEANKLELQIARFELDQVLDKATDLFGYRAQEKGISLFCTKSPECPATLEGDRLRLAQVLNNLLSNALKFTEKGHIQLQVEPVQSNRQLQFTVKDTGIGLSAEQCEQLFKPFSQVDDSSSRRYGGAGLGLSICKSLVELMGGKIWVESEPGQGTRFCFTVSCLNPSYHTTPALPKLALPAGQPANLQNNTQFAGKHILVVDDHKLNRMVASEMLKRWGAQVSLAEDGLQAVTMCAQHRFDLVLMDIQMPELDGFGACAEILRLLGDSAPPIVAVTASATEKDRQAVLEAGMVEHVVKPFKKETLHRVLESLTSQPSGSQ